MVIFPPPIPAPPFSSHTSSCVDKLSGRRIRKKLCGPKSSRPSGKTRRCNTFSCNFEWASDRWEPCTHTCGSQGLRIRQTHCLPTNVSNLSGNLSTSGEVVQMWTKLVDPRKCPGDRPERIQECNRFPCPAKWESTGTSTYLSTCPKLVRHLSIDRMVRLLRNMWTRGRPENDLRVRAP